MEDNQEALYLTTDKIKKNLILLPDFQRNFVWNDPDVQRDLVASVIAKLPIGSILLLSTNNPNEYACKVLGSKRKIKKEELPKDSMVSFLLDGQQRATVLTMVFSDTIFSLNSSVSDLITRDSLKRRFFIKFPMFDNLELNDPFGLWNLKFTTDDPKADEPPYITSDVRPIIDYLTFTVGASDLKKAYNPYNKDPMKLTSLKFDGLFAGCYAIPLFLLDKDSKYRVRLSQLIDGIAEDVLKMREQLIHILLGLEDNDSITPAMEYRMKQLYSFAMVDGKFDLKSFLDYEKNDSAINVYISSYNESSDPEEIYESYITGLSDKKSEWVEDMKSYLIECVDSINLKQLVLKETERNRAIDIFENMNKGGVKLDIFDLIMARVAIVTEIPFNDRIREFIKTGKDLTVNNSECYFNYPEKLFFDNDIKLLFMDLKNQGDYIASNRVKCLDSKDKNLVSKYKEGFLNVLSLITYKNDYINDLFLSGHLDAKGFSIDVMKEDLKLAMNPESIFNNCRVSCVAMDRAFYFFQIRCGIRDINEINYALMIPLIAYILHDDNNYIGPYSEQVFNLLEAWYWASIFSGAYDRNQNIVMITDLNNLIKNIHDITNGKKTNLDWLKDRIDKILAADRFSDLDFMVYEKAYIGEVPKTILKAFVCQYCLSKGYYDLVKNDQGTVEFINVFSNKATDLQMHHVIPLGTATGAIKSSTKELRKNSLHFLNSPLNMLYITEYANRIISDQPLSVYASNIPVQSDLQLVGFSGSDDLKYDHTDDDKKAILKKRHASLRAMIINESTKLINNL